MAVVSDDFNRADNATTLGTAPTGQTWEVLTPGAIFGITGGKAYRTSAGTTNQAIAVINSGVADGDIEVTLDTGADSGVCWRATDDSNYFFVASQNGVIYRRQAGGFNEVAAFVGSAGGGTYRIEMRGNTFTIFKDGAQRATFTDSFQNTATKHGLRVHDTTSALFDNFTVTAITPPVGTATGTLAFVGAAAGTAPAVAARVGSATGTWTYAGAAVGSTARSGTAVGTLAYAGSAVGSSPRRGAATGTLAFSGAAVGSAPAPAGLGVQSLGTSPLGTGFSDGIPRGLASGTLATVGVATGSTVRRGTAVGTVTFTGLAVGTAPVAGAKAGAGAGTWVFTGTAVGSTPGSDTFHPHTYGYATLASNGVSVATLTTT